MKSYHNLYRGMQVSFTFWRSIVLAVVAALLVGLLWGGNIAVLIYPIIEVAYKNKTFTTWIDEKIEHAETEWDAANQDTPEKNITPWERGSLRWKLSVYRFARPLAEKYTPHTPYQTVVFLVIIALFGTFIKAGLVVVHAVLTTHIVTSTLCKIREDFFAKLLDYEVNYFSQTGTSEAMSRFLGDTGTLAGGFGVIYGSLIREPIKLLVCLAVAAWISWQLLLVTMIVVPVAFLAVRWIAKALRRVSFASMNEMVRVYGRLDESVRSIRIVKAFTQEPYEREKFLRLNKNVYKWALKGAKYDALTQPLTEILGIVMMSLAMLVGVYLLLTQRTAIFGISMMSRPIDEGSLLLFYAMLAGAAEPGRKLTGIFQSFQAASVAADRVYAMLDRDIPLLDPLQPVTCGRHTETLRFEGVHFYYQPGKSILRGIDLEIRFGETVAFVGANGCGKSTLLSLVPRFADPTAGRILLDSVPLTAVTQHSLRRQMGIVTQDTVLFNETIFENIRYGDAQASPEEVVAAAKRALAHEFIVGELPQGYETLAGQGGGRLSGGQRQRIALARAILRDPAVLLLDEATSQIDLASEQKIHEALATFVGKRTTLIVTHRLSALSLANRIVVMNSGVIEAVGTHRELIGRNDYYTQLYQHQTEA